MDQEQVEREIKNRLATSDAFAQSERQEKEKQIRYSKEAIELIKSFTQKICKENNKEISPMRDDLEVNQVAIVAISILQALYLDLCNKTNNTENLQKNSILENENARLKEENTNLLSELNALKIKLEKRNTAEQQVKTNKPEETETSQKKEIEPDKTLIEVTSDNPLLKLASTSKLLKLDDLVELSTSKLQLSVKETKEQITDLEQNGFLETYNTPIRPIQGYTYPTLFRLTQKGLDATHTTSSSEFDRLLKNTKGIFQKELPLLVFAVEEYLPKHSYFFVSYASEVEYVDADNNLHVFTPHVQLRDENGRTIFLMYEGEGYQDGANLRQYFKDYSVVSDKEAYFLCPHNKMIDALTGKVNSLNYPTRWFNKIYYTNITDWAVYDRMIANSDKKRPQSIWFGKLIDNKGK